MSSPPSSIPVRPSALSPAILPVYRRSEICMVAGQGCWLTDSHGKRYLDFGSGIAVNALGHHHPKVTAALTAQAAQLWHCSNYFTTPLLAPLSERLCALSGFAHAVFFSSSGAEANEAAIKFIRRAHWMREKEGKREAKDATTARRHRILSIAGGFHGRTLACLAACKSPRAVEGFGPLPEGFDQAPFNDIAALEAAITPETAAILLEPIQGEGGVHAHAPEYLRAARALADQHGLFLWFDEVQCGLGRTGTLFTYEALGFTPNVVTIAKGLGNGFPIGATLVNTEIAGAMTPGSHGSTFGSNPLALAVADAVLTELSSDELLANVLARSEELALGLSALVTAHPTLLTEARGVGLMQGLAVKPDAYRFMEILRDAGLLTVAAGHGVLRILPPLIVSAQEVQEALAILHRVCSDFPNE